MRYYQTLEAPHVVYRVHNDAGELIYVGVTRCFSTRFARHAERSPWWREVATIKIEHHPNALSARRAESAAILIEQPRYNRVTGDDAQLRAAEPAPRGDGVHCPRCAAIKEKEDAAYCLNCMREYQRARRRAAGVKPMPPPTTKCPKCGGVKPPGPNYCKPCKRAYDAEYRRAH